MIKKLKELNPALRLYHIEDGAFSQYGKRLTNYDFTEYLTIMNHRPVPQSGNIYIGNDPDLYTCAVTTQVSVNTYADMPIQVGYCNGTGHQLNAMEYHKGNEINIAITDLVLLLGDIRDIHANTYSSNLTEAFFLPAGSACELYGTTLHFAPCAVSNLGFKSIVILPQETNTPIDKATPPTCEEEQLLWMRNKWLIAHPDSTPASLGACAGIQGANIILRYN